MKIDDLKNKPLLQMTGEEFLYLQENSGQKEVKTLISTDTSKKHVYGISGITRERIGNDRPYRAECDPPECGSFTGTLE